MITEKDIRKAIGVPLYNSKRLACCLTDSKLRFVFINEAFSTISGYKKEEVVGKSVGYMLNSKFFKRALKEFAGFLKHGKQDSDKWFYVTKDGKVQDATVESSRLEINGKTYVLTIALDISRESELQKKLAKTKDLLTETELMSGKGSFQFNPVEEDVVWTDGMFHLFGLEPAETAPLLEVQRTYISDEDVERYQNAIMKCLHENKDVNLKITLSLPDGKQKIVHCIARKDKSRENWIYGSAKDITEREKDQEKLSNSLKEKETLLQEIHHRVKNNLAIVVSLLQLQVFKSEKESEKNLLMEAQNRVQSIAMVHELLYQSDDLSSVDLGIYYEKLLHIIAINMRMQDQNVKTDLLINIDALSINQAIPLGLIINELATNSFKYAFHNSGSQGVIGLKIEKEDGVIKVKYNDNGPGYNVNSDNFIVGLGSKIIDSLAEQLEGEYHIDSENRFEFSLSFAEKKTNLLG